MTISEGGRRRSSSATHPRIEYDSPLGSIDRIAAGYLPVSAVGITSFLGRSFFKDALPVVSREEIR
jgi:hypothetical protein